MRPKPQRQKRSFWRTCRVYFRRFRIALWLLTLTFLGTLLYLNQVGLPGFVKAPLLQRLRERGLDLQFSRLRLRWYQGIVAEDVRFGSVEAPNRPRLVLREVQVGLNWRALTHRQLQVDQLVLHEGRLVWRVPDDPAGRELAFDHIHTALRFLPDDQWALDHLNADFVNAKIRLSGMVTNASAIAEWHFFQGNRAEAASTARWQNRLRRLADTLGRIHFAVSPELRLDIQGDARSLTTFDVRMHLNAADADTPWGTVSNGRFSARLFAADTNGTSRADLNLEAADAETRWASITNFHMGIRLASMDIETNLIAGLLSLSAGYADTPWARGSNVVFTAEWTHSITNPVPLSGQGRLLCAAASSQWADVRTLELTGTLSTPPPLSLPPYDPSWAWWTNLHPFALDWRCSLTELNVSGIRGDNIDCSGTWLAPRLKVNTLATTLYGGKLELEGQLDVASRIVATRVKSEVDPQKIAPSLPENARRWLDQFKLNSPPRLDGRVALTLPSWTNRAPDWSAEVLPTLNLGGNLALESGGSYRQVLVSSARGKIAYTNMTWHLNDLTLSSPEGRVVAQHRASDRTKDFYWHVKSSIHPRALLPLLDDKARKGFEMLKLTEPPLIDAEVWGRSHAPDLIGAKARVALTNFSFRGQSASGLQTEVLYTNKVLTFVQPRVQRGAQRISADAVSVDFNAQLVYLTNGFSTAEPMVVARAIGDKIGQAIEPYTFSNPPVAHVSGIIPMHGEEGADLQFQLEGGPFHWWRINVPWIAGTLHWSGLRLTMRDVRANFYRGGAAGFADFQFPPGEGCNFTCSVAVTNALLQQLMADLSSSSNHLEGTLNGTLNFTRANTADWNKLFGYGELHLRDGLIWDIPLFGIFTPVLEGISPGLGHSRASAATCSYFITNGIIRTDDLEIRSQPMRLQYRGTVDLESRVNAKVEAEMLRDMWLVGPLVSTVLWPVTKMFEYRVTGTLGEPKSEPIFIVPKLVLMPFHPFRTLKSLLPEEPSTRTNAPPLFTPIQP